MHAAPLSFVRAELLRVGFLDWGRFYPPGEVENAVRDYQALHGLAQDGVAGPVTLRSFREFRFCGLPDKLELAEQICKWNKREIAWSITGSLPGLSDLDQKQAYSEAWSYWSDVCNLSPIYSDNSRTADVLMGAGRIDGAMGVLAQSELPCGNPRRLVQQYDDGEPWVIAENPPPHKIDLVRVAAHEIGHVIGIGHIARGNLLAPTYNPQVRRPQAGDIAEAVQRYGPRATPPTPPQPTPPPTPSEFVTLTLQLPRSWLLSSS